MKKFSIDENTVPSFTAREMIVLSLLLVVGAFFFIQSFKSYGSLFNDALDDLFKISEIHNALEKKYAHGKQRKGVEKFEETTPEFKDLVFYYKDLFEDIEKLPNRNNQPLITYTITSKLTTSYDEEIEQILAEYKSIIEMSSYAKTTNASFQEPLSTLYTLIREKQKSYAYLTNNYRTATYITIFLIVIYSSYIFIRHYSQERSRAILSNNAKTDFLANMSHEIRTPLNGIIGMSELIQATPLSNEQDKYLKALLLSAENLNELINDILDITKIEAGHIELELVPFDLNEIIGTLISSFEFRAKSKKLTISKNITPDLHMTYIGDPTRIRQILTNLIGNALKFTETGHIRVSVQPNEQKPDELYFEVEDTGIGIPESKREYIFQKFSQADSSTTRKYGGTGLGLVITKNLVNFMGGHIDFKSNDFEGTTFWFSLPLLKTDPESIILHNTLSPLDFTQITGKKILLVEDNIVNQDYALKILHDMQLNTTLAETGISAVQYFRDHGPKIDLILMDCRMPEMDGYEATQLIRDLEKIQNPSKKVPIIALTANAIKGDIERCMSCGMDDYLTKPIHRRTLETTITNWILKGNHEMATTPCHIRESTINPVINKDIYREISSVMGSDMAKFIQHYIESISYYSEKINSGLKTGNYKEIADAAHPLKSSSASLGATQMETLSMQIERAATDNDRSQKLESLILQMNDISKHTLQALKELQHETT